MYAKKKEEITIKKTALHMLLMTVLFFLLKMKHDNLKFKPYTMDLW